MGTIAQEISRIQTAAATIRTKAVAMGIASTTDKIDTVASAISSKVTPVEGTTYAPSATRTIKAGAYLKGDVVVSAATVDDLASTMKQTKTATPTTSDQTISADTGKLLSSVTVKGVSVSLPAAGNILTGSSASVTSNGTSLGSVSGTMANQGTYTGTITSQNGTIKIPAGYHNGNGVITATLGAGAYTATVGVTGGSASNTVTGMTTATTSPYYVTLATSAGSATATASVSTSGFLSTGSKTDTKSVSVSGAGVTYIKQGSVTPTTSNYTAPTAKVSTSGISSDAISSSVTTHYVQAVQNAAGSVKGTATVTEGYVKSTDGGDSTAKSITIADSAAVYLKDASITPTTGTLSTTMETVSTGGYAVSSGTSKVVVGAGYTDGATKDVTPATIRIKGSTTTNNGVVASAPTGSTHIQPTEKITISKGYVENDIVIYGEKADVADEATAAEGVSVSITNSHAGITPVWDATNSHYDIKKDISVSTSVTKDGWWGGSKTATASNVILGAIPKLTYSVTGNAASASVSTDPTASASVTACDAVKTASSGSFYLTYSASANSGVATASVPAQTVTLTAGYSAGDTVTVAAKSATSTAKTASKSGVTYIQAGVIGATASVTDVTVKKDTTNSTLPTNSSKGTNDYILKVVKDGGGALTYSGSVTTEGYVNSSKNTGSLTGTAAGVTGKEFYVSKGSITPTVTNVSKGSATLSSSSTLPTKTTGATGDYTIIVTGNAGSAKATATVSTDGYVKAADGSTTATATSVGVDGFTAYVSKGSVTPSIKSTTNATVKVDSTSTVSTHSTEATEDYKIVISQNAAGTATPQASISAGYIPASTPSGTAGNVGVDTLTAYISKATASKTDGTASASTSVTGMVTTTTNTGYAVSASASTTAASASITAGYAASATSASTEAKSASDSKYIQKGVLSADCSVSSGSASLDMGGISTHTSKATGDYTIVLSTTAGSATGTAGVSTEGYVKSETASSGTKTVSVTGGKTVYVTKAAASKTSMSFTDDGGSDSVTISAGYNPSTITITGSCTINRITEAWISSNLF